MTNRPTSLSAMLFLLSAMMLVAGISQVLADDPINPPSAFDDPGTPANNYFGPPPTRTCNYAGDCLDGDPDNACIQQDGPVCISANGNIACAGRKVYLYRKLGVCQANAPPAINPGCKDYNAGLECAYYYFFQTVTVVGTTVTCDNLKCYKLYFTTNGPRCIYGQVGPF